MESSRARSVRAALLLGFALLAQGCGPDVEGAPDEQAARARPTRGSRRAVRQRSEAWREACRALERRDTAGVRRLLPSLEDPLGTRLLRARLYALEGDDVAAVRELEEARTSRPGDPRVFATAGELHAAAGRLESAREEIRTGLEVAGDAAELERARGVLLISHEGGAQAGLGHLQKALVLDPDLEFVERPLAQANLLLGNLAMSDGDLAAALGHALAALEHDAGNADARTLQADALAGLGRLEEAIVLYRELFEEGEELAGTLGLVHQRAATAAMVAGDRDRALEHYLAARDLGVPDADLGFGRHVLEQESERATSRGWEAWEAGEAEPARAELERAVRLDPSSAPARDRLGLVLYRGEDFEGAAEQWRWILESVYARGEVLDQPLHLDLARCLYRAGRYDEVRRTLGQYLEREPRGAFVDPTREMIARLEAEGR